MDKFFNPKSVAVVGASADEKKVGGMILKNLLESGFKGKIFPINPEEELFKDKELLLIFRKSILQ